MAGTSGFRCGIGYDTHRLVAGRKLILGGVEIPAERGLLAHSDGDVLAHAITDALLGAAGLGDIGQHFPDTNPRWLNAGSMAFLKATQRMLRKNRLAILHIDSVVVIDRPKLAPHLSKMRSTLASALGIASSQVSVKAKTSEGATLDIAAAHAVALLGPLKTSTRKPATKKKARR